MFLIMRFTLISEFLVLDAKKLSLLHYEDAILGPRRLPLFDNPTAGKVQIEDTDVFSVDLDSKKVLLKRDSVVKDIGSQIIYIIKN